MNVQSIDRTHVVHWQVAQQVHRELVSLVQAPMTPPQTEARHGTH